MGHVLDRRWWRRIERGAPAPSVRGVPLTTNCACTPSITALFDLNTIGLLDFESCAPRVYPRHMSRAAFVLAVVIGACGPGLKPPDAREAAKASASDLSGEPATIATLLHDSVTLGNLLFDDAACASAFPPGEVHADKLAELARCLSTLRLHPNGREDALGDVAVLSYGPGFEVEARIIRMRDRSQLTWIGFASQHPGTPNAPTLDTAAFEALRTGGQRVPVFDAATTASFARELSPGDEAAVMWLKVCLDESGAVTDVHPYTPPSYVMMDAFVTAARTWTFRPFLHAGQPVPVCSMVQMSYPADKAPPIEELPLPPPKSKFVRPPLSLAQRAFVTLMEGKRIAGRRTIVPDDATKPEIAKYRGQEIKGSFRVCLDVEGRVESVLPMRSTGFPAYDRDLLTGIATWRYSPYSINGEAVPVCTAVTFIYLQR